MDKIDLQTSRPQDKDICRNITQFKELPEMPSYFIKVLFSQYVYKAQELPI